jgi:tetratricopeptide (TPR) repeat protein
MNFTESAAPVDRCDLNAAHFEKEVDQLCQKTGELFKKIHRFYFRFHSGFLLAALLELSIFGFIFHYFPTSSILALFLSLIVLTLFSHVVLFSYLQLKKPHQLTQLIEIFVTQCRDLLSKTPDEAPFALSFVLQRLSFRLTLSDKMRYRWMQRSPFLVQLVFKWRIWTEWKDLLHMKERLFSAAIKEQIAFIKEEPSDLEGHARLAQLYRLFSKCYSDPQKLAMNERLAWMPKAFYREEMAARSKQLLNQALQELLIISEYAPQDPWVHTQLAALYQELQMPDKELLEYEKILAMSPEDKEALFLLGVSYFQMGENAKGLRVYERLKQLSLAKAHQLITYYYGSDS